MKLLFLLMLLPFATFAGRLDLQPIPENSRDEIDALAWALYTAPPASTYAGLCAVADVIETRYRWEGLTYTAVINECAHLFGGIGPVPAWFTKQGDKKSGGINTWIDTCYIVAEKMVRGQWSRGSVASFWYLPKSKNAWMAGHVRGPGRKVGKYVFGCTGSKPFW